MAVTIPPETSKADRARVLITDAQERSVLAACRSLAQRGYAVDAAASERPAATHWSRFCANRFWTADPKAQPAEFVEELERIVSVGGYHVLIAGTDASLLAISRRREQLEPYVDPGLPAQEIVERSLSKVALLDLAAEAGIPAPETAVSTDPEAALEAARRFGYPVMLKSGDVVFEREGQLRRLGSAVVYDEPSLQRLLPEYGDSWLVQRVEPGTLLSFAGVMAGGRLLAHAVSRYRRTWPPEAGSVAFSETVEPPAGLCDKVRALLTAMEWEGIFELELLETPGHSPSTLDMNPRVYGSLALADRAGAPLPAVWCDWLLSRRYAAKSAQPGYRYRWDDAEIRRFGWLVRYGQVRSIPDLVRPRPRTVRAHLWRSDPLPLAARLIALLRHRGVRLRKPRALPRAAPSVIATPPVSGQVEVAIVGSGPYGLSSAAFLRDAGVGVRLFGEPMGYWRGHMPRGMLLRSRWRSSHIADPHRSLTLDAFERERGIQLAEHVPIERFIEYGLWFQRNVAPDVDERRVERIARSNGSFGLELDDGEEVRAKRVVVSAGLHGFAHRPGPLGDLPRELVSHSSEHVEFAEFRGRSVLVVGAGQSALESAAFLSDAGAEVEAIVRSPSVRWLRQDRQPATAREYAGELSRPPTDVGGRLGWVAAAPDLYRVVPQRLRALVTERCLVPRAGQWLKPPLADVTFTLDRRIVDAEPAGSGVRIRLDDGSVRAVDHIVLGTGFRIDAGSYPFLSEGLVSQLDLIGGYPRLGPGLESSVPGLHFTGAPASLSFGPITRFVVGTWYAAPALVERVVGKPRHKLRLSYRPRWRSAAIAPRAGKPSTVDETRSAVAP
jgi:cation diffusion facilitator CzcD-associated flavoprotein CzcO/predicted ATP-grasp superfamily ATP-dependent carboligase